MKSYLSSNCKLLMWTNLNSELHLKHVSNIKYLVTVSSGFSSLVLVLSLIYCCELAIG